MPSQMSSHVQPALLHVMSVISQVPIVLHVLGAISSKAMFALQTVGLTCLVILLIILAKVAESTVSSVQALLSAPNERQEESSKMEHASQDVIQITYSQDLNVICVRPDVKVEIHSLLIVPHVIVDSILMVRNKLIL